MLTASRTATETSNARANQHSPLGLTARMVMPNCDNEVTAVEAITRWLLSRHADNFPYEAVTAAFNCVGKHFVAIEVLDALAGVRAALPQVRGSVLSVGLLDQFLDAALDKRDGRYANPTYLGLNLLPLAEVDDAVHDFTAAQRQYDRLFVQLISDAARFEIAAAEGSTSLLPHMRPDVLTSAKRCRLVLQLAGPATRRLNLGDAVDVADPIAGARQLWTKVAADCTPIERLTLRLTMLPVSQIHDEYQFIRILQSFEATFALIAVQLHTAIRALISGEADSAEHGLLAAEQSLHEAAPLFSLVATMQIEAFQTFRQFTEGASAIQSRNYKLVESLCRQPDATRLDSAAYLSVPEVRQRVLAGQVTLNDAFDAARREGRLTSHEMSDLEQAMQRFALTLLKWRRTHHRIAARMLGEKSGTGYTEGAGYLKSVQEIPVFPSLSPPTSGVASGTGEPHSERDDRTAHSQTRQSLGARGRCPFAGGDVSPDMIRRMG